MDAAAAGIDARTIWALVPALAIIRVAWVYLFDRHGPGAVQTTGPDKASAVSNVAASLQAGATRVNPKDGLTYVWIPPGKFMVGCSPSDNECEDFEKPAHEVTLTKGFWTGQTEVTQEAYQRVTKSNPSTFTGGKLPVENVSWTEADEYCRATSGRLPTEAEWEYSAPR
jgi:formylglycine-generating enzyme required for sulfatase activity